MYIFSANMKKMSDSRGRSLLVIVAATTTTTATALHTATAHAARATATEGRGERKVDVLLAVQPHNERGNVANLLADADVALADQHARVVDGLGKAQLEDLCLQTPLHDLRVRQAKDIIELLLALRQQTQADHATQQGLVLRGAKPAH